MIFLQIQIKPIIRRIRSVNVMHLHHVAVDSTRFACSLRLDWLPLAVEQHTLPMATIG